MIRAIFYTFTTILKTIGPALITGLALVTSLSAALQAADANDVKQHGESGGMLIVDPVPSTDRYLVLFESGNAVIHPEVVRQDLKDIIYSVSVSNPPFHISIIGYTDRVGSDAANMRLSLRRARAVRKFLVDAGVPASVIAIEGHGEGYRSGDMAVPTVDGVPEAANRIVKLIVDFYPPDQ
jgi:outer membrane protein OmpA-like peptidoglycan-associated protein